MATAPFRSPLIAATGLSFGDEGKGRLIPEVIRELVASTGRPDPVAMVLKVNGGANSGHTAGGLKLNLLPAGVIEESVPRLGLGAGVVADPRKLEWETTATEAHGFRVRERLCIDERTMVSDLGHRLLDLAGEFYRERKLGLPARGSTGRGITPAFSDETAQWQIFYSDFRGAYADFREKFRQRLRRALDLVQAVYGVDGDHWYAFFDRLSEAERRANAPAVDEGVLPAEEFDFHRFRTRRPFELQEERLTETYWEAGRRFLDQVTDLREVVLGALADGRSVLGEFGQSFWLDKRNGFPPNVTASHAWTPEFFLSAGIPVQPVHTIGVCKAYDTKVGTHDFLTEMPRNHPLSDKLRQIEFGTSTGRQRMVGWFDAVEKGSAVRYGGCEDLVINKLDALSQEPDWAGPLLLCAAYRGPDGETYRKVPRDPAFRAQCTPLYEEYRPWSADLSACRSYADLPGEARDYLAGMVRHTVECAVGPGGDPPEALNLRYVGIGPNPSEILHDLPPVAELLENDRARGHPHLHT